MANRNKVSKFQLITGLRRNGRIAGRYAFQRWLFHVVLVANYKGSMTMTTCRRSSKQLNGNAHRPTADRTRQQEKGFGELALHGSHGKIHKLHILRCMRQLPQQFAEPNRFPKPANERAMDGFRNSLD